MGDVNMTVCNQKYYVEKITFFVLQAEEVAQSPWRCQIDRTLGKDSETFHQVTWANVVGGSAVVFCTKHLYQRLSFVPNICKLL